MTRIAGLLLAAGSGRRYGTPKALVDTGEGPWVLRALTVLAGCDPITVVVGASGDEVAALLPPGVIVVGNPDHATGMASSLRAGLRAVQAIDPPVEAVLITLVDLPDVTAAVAARVAAVADRPGRNDIDDAVPAGDSARNTGVLARATFRGRPGHPVLIGRDHFSGVISSLAQAGPDAGAGRYLATNDATAVECGDLATGADQDRPGRA